jgi:hypothetical protein
MSTAPAILTPQQGDLLQFSPVRFHLKIMHSQSRQTPHATLDVQQQTEVTQDLQLLADFVADMPVVGVQSFQLAGEMGSTRASRVVRDASSRMFGERCSTRGRVKWHARRVRYPV